MASLGARFSLVQRIVLSIAKNQVARSRRWLLPRVGVLSAPLFCGSLLLAAPSCRPAQPPPALATGERPVTGVERYDRFFADVGAARTSVEEARAEEGEARHALARRVGLPEAAAIDAIGARLRERTARWADEGLMLELEFTGIDDTDSDEAAPEAGDAPGATAESTPPSATLRTPGREPQRRELRLLEALAQASLSGATVYANMGRARQHVERLEAELAELRGQLDGSFADPGARERVAAKLDEAAVLLPELKAGAREVGGSADALISVLEEAANTVPVVPGRRRLTPSAKPGEPRAPGARPSPPPASSAGAAPPPPTAQPTSPPMSSPAHPANAPGAAGAGGTP